MPTSLQDPHLAKRTRDSLPPTEWDKEREWVPLWLAGPILALGGVVGMIAILMALAAAYEWLQKVTLQ